MNMSIMNVDIGNNVHTVTRAENDTIMDKQQIANVSRSVFGRLSNGDETNLYTIENNKSYVSCVQCHNTTLASLHCNFILLYIFLFFIINLSINRYEH